MQKSQHHILAAIWSFLSQNCGFLLVEGVLSSISSEELYDFERCDIFLALLVEMDDCGLESEWELGIGISDCYSDPKNINVCRLRYDSRNN